jgi:hypothetical protein
VYDGLDIQMSPKFESQPYRDKLDVIRDQFRQLYDERMPVLGNYEDFAKTALDTLIGETAPMARDMYRTAANYTAETSDFLRSAQAFDTPERRQQERGKAMADVTSASEQARSNAISQLESFGIDPSQTRSASMDQNLRVQTALEAVRAGKAAESAVEGQGREYTAQALGLKGQATQQQAQAGATGANVLSNNFTQSANMVGTGINVAGAGENLLSGRMATVQNSAALKQAEQASKLAAKAGESAGWAGIGSAVGMAAGAALGASGGPMGMMAGAQIGGALGGSVAGGGQGARAGF